MGDIETSVERERERYSREIEVKFAPLLSGSTTYVIWRERGREEGGRERERERER